MEEADKNEYLDRYLAGEPMSDEQRECVKQWLRQDPELRSKARFLLQMHDHGRHRRRKALPDMVASVLLARPFTWAAAASVGLAISVGVWWYNQPSRITPTATSQKQPPSVTPTPHNQFGLHKVAVYEQRGDDLGFAKSDQPADSTFLLSLSTDARHSPEYQFAHYDTLRIRMSADMLAKQWHLVSVNGFDYQLVSDDSVTYPLELGRELWLPLKAE